MDVSTEYRRSDKQLSANSLSLLIEPFLGQQTLRPPYYSCPGNSSDVTFTLSSSDHSAQQTSTNCSLSQCSTSSSSNNSCRLSPTPCFDYHTSNNVSYCAPAILCSILTPCNNVTNNCTSNTSVCVINSCCSPKAVCLPLPFTQFCTTINTTLNITGKVLP